MIEFTLKEIKKNGDSVKLMAKVMELIEDEISSGVLNDEYDEITWHTIDEVE